MLFLFKKQESFKTEIYAYARRNSMKSHLTIKVEYPAGCEIYKTDINKFSC